jgi:hypothetical protein
MFESDEQDTFIRESGLDDPNGWDKAVDDQFWFVLFFAFSAVTHDKGQYGLV